MVSDVSSLEQTVGRYMLFGAIGSGGMATVHLGRRIGAAGFARLVAIKRLHPHLAADREVVNSFLDEARIAARVTHPNVVSIHDVVLAGDEVLLVMEYVPGRSLALLAGAERTAGRAIPPAVAAAISLDLLRGLQAAHEARDERGRVLGVIHRDVSPHNVLVGTDGVARVLDFGIAKALGRLQTTATGAVKGKLAYMAPERLLDREATASVDVYGAAVLIWELLAGARYFDGPSDETMVPRVLTATYRPLEVPMLAAASAVLERALQRDPAQRHASASELASALRDALTVATHDDVAAWVQRVAAKELAANAEAIEEIEQRSVPSAVPFSKEAAPRRTEAPETAREGPFARREGNTPETSSPIVTSPRPLATDEARWSRARLAATLLASVALVLIVALGGIAASRPTSARASASVPAADPLPSTAARDTATAEPETPATPPLPVASVAVTKLAPAARPGKRGSVAPGAGPGSSAAVASPIVPATATPAQPEAPTDRK